MLYVSLCNLAVHDVHIRVITMLTDFSFPYISS